MAKKYVVRLSSDEREKLHELVNKGKAAAYKRLHAQILLKADVNNEEGEWTDQRISEAFDVTTRTVERVRQRLCMHGLDAAIDRAKGSGKPRKFDGVQEAHLIALICDPAPEGRNRWTLRLLADKYVQLGHAEELSHETVRRLLKKRAKTLADERVVHIPQE